uniref:Uncharacterized protein n=1 Tax=Phage sp. ctqZP6 TaxID=2828010 RepID=A0A8S5SI16_9VIRU|nr:MAG TPA: hypothetical protein [Phage sp. ctqZP6]
MSTPKQQAGASIVVTPLLKSLAKRLDFVRSHNSHSHSFYPLVRIQNFFKNFSKGYSK